MIVYENSLRNFIIQCNNGIIADQVACEMHKAMIPFSHNEERYWLESLPFVARALDDNSLNKEMNVAIEYKSQLNKTRIDFLIYGKNDLNEDSIVIVELKQWSKINASNKPNYIYAIGGGGIPSDYPHPSYQALRYAYILGAFNEYVQNNDVNINSCSYCHNMDNIYNKYINDITKYRFLDESPCYLKDDAYKLREFVKNYVTKPSRILLYDIDNAHIRPSKDFSKMLYGAINDNQIFSLDDGQAESVATIIYETNKSLIQQKRKTIIIKGGPGCGVLIKVE